MDRDLALEVNDRLTEESNVLLERYDIERVHRSSGSQLLLAGLSSDDAASDDAARFVWAAIKLVADVGAEFGLQLSMRARMAAGDIASRVLGTSQVSFGVWGGPPGVAVTLASLAQPGQLLADAFAAEQLGREWDLGPLDNLPGVSHDIDVHVVNGPMNAHPAQG
jgi:class 3 adenylate cyclase